MAWIRSTKRVAGVTPPSKVTAIFLSDFTSLSTKDSDTLYNILVDNTSRLSAVYVGDTLMSAYDPSDYDYLAISIFSSGYSLSDRDTGIKLFSTANINRDWEMEFSCRINTSASGDKSVVGIGSGNNFRMYVEYTSNGLQIGIPSASITFSGISYQDGDIFKFVRESTDLKLYKNDTLVDTKTFNPASTNENDTLQLGQYGSNAQDFMKGYIEFFAFKFND